MDRIEDYFYELKKCPLLRGIETDEMKDLFTFLGGYVREYSRGESLLHVGDLFSFTGIVLEGHIEGSFINENMDQVDINSFSPSDAFGMALNCQNELSVIELSAVKKSVVLHLDLRIIYSMQQPETPAQMKLLRNLLNSFSRQVVFLHRKVRVLSQKSIRDRIKVYFSEMPRKGSTVSPGMNKTSLARLLGVDRSALSRELSRMQDEGIIRVDKNTYEIIDEDFLYL